MAETCSLIQKLTYEAQIDCIAFGEHLSLHSKGVQFYYVWPQWEVILPFQLYDQTKRNHIIQLFFSSNLYDLSA